MSPGSVEAIQEIYRAAVEAARPRNVLKRVIKRQHGSIIIGDRQHGIVNRPVYALALGKAAAEMLAEVERIVDVALVDGLAITKSYPEDLQLRSRVVLGSHPVPDQKSLDAGKAALQFASDVPDGSLVICLISGGGSALMEVLRPGVSLDDLQRATRALLRAGASIHELNAVRARLSTVKAGGLLAAFGKVEVANIVISDVLGDDLSTIASGPTVPMRDPEAAEDVLARYGVSFSLPDNVEPVSVATPVSIIAGNLSMVIDAAAASASEMGFEPVVLSRSLTGEARHLGATFGSILVDSKLGQTAFGPSTCLLAGGESTVTVAGNGLGGRNTEAALAAAIRVSGVDGVALGFLATDGDDAETGAAGGIVTGDTVNPPNLAVARKALADNDSYTLLSELGAAWGMGATGTNVNDLVIGIVT